ncbi:MerR family transcriptional regulator [Lacticaseibacillus brantae]|uniref:MerR family transcriptional regulator n=1 Tax=Lacticaseibacillus brantae DSM 23927 TaxID=1423727 RepID=A0A0R2AXS0_9LACO|nr:MerR family transcriptional regulator [Lacticaseibacillus brantae]KRM71815.1 MerR family transcriptional regulator [Lacticaseibacillus brantae DSM 23927]
MNIKTVAETLDMTIDTIRYYERIGVVPPVPRDKNGYRDYQIGDINQLFIAKALRNAGLSIESMVEFADLEQTPGEVHAAQKELLQDQLDKLNQKLKEIERTRDLMQYKVETFDERAANRNKQDLNVEKLWEKYSL